MAHKTTKLRMRDPVELTSAFHRKTPVALFAYNRADHVGRALESLALCQRLEECQVYLYCDGSKGAHDGDSVQACRKIVSEWAPKLHAEVIQRPNNLGLARSIERGVTDLCREYGRVIAIEDDLVLSPYFLDYMLKSLDRYAEVPEVYQISGHMFPGHLSVDDDAVFLPFITSWGWATWQRAWKHFDRDILGYLTLRKDPKLRQKFDLDDSFPYFRMLEFQRDGKIDSWAICWYLTVFLQKALVLYPSQTLVNNMGFDGTGTHGKDTHPDVTVIDPQFMVQQFPKSVTIMRESFDLVKEYLRKMQLIKTSKIKHFLQNFIKSKVMTS